MGLLRIATILLLGGLPFGGTASGAAAKLAFKPDIKLRFQAGQPFSMPLTDLLSDTGSGGKLTFAILPNSKNFPAVPFVPTWIEANNTTGTLNSIGPVPENIAQDFTFFMSVQEDDPSSNPGDITQKPGVTLSIFTVPVWNTKVVDLGQIPEESTFPGGQFDLTKFVKDPAGKPLIFSLDDPNKKFPSVANKGWITMTDAGLLTGTPGRPDVEKFSGFSFIATTQSGGSSSLPGQGEVLFVFHPPKWTGNPLTLPDATEDQAYTQDISLAKYLTYTESPPLTFTVTSSTNADWLSIPANGVLKSPVLSATPNFQNANPGPVLLTVKVSTTFNGQVFEDTTQFQFNFNLVPKPPVVKTPIVLPDAIVQIGYGPQDLTAFASDPHKLPLTYTIKPNSGPAWGTVSPNGQFNGIPQVGDIGVNKWTLVVSNGAVLNGAPLTAEAELQVKVNPRPPYWLTKPLQLPQATEDSKYQVDLNTFAVDPEKNPMTFTLGSDAPAWLSIDANGNLIGIPHAPDVGYKSFHITVSDAKVPGTDTAQALLTVIHVNHPPKWVPNPLSLPDAPERSPYTQSLVSYVKDPDTGDTFTYTLVSGPSWAKVTADGTLEGTPLRGDLGLNSFKVKVTDQGGLFDTATINVTVTKVPRAPVCQTPVTLPVASQGQDYSTTIATLAKDLDNEMLTFAADSEPPWMTTASNGALTGKPTMADIGKYQAKFKVTNTDGLSCTIDADGEVKQTVLPIVWIQNPIVLPNALVGKNYAQSLLPYVKDPNPGATLQFHLDLGAPWVSLTTSGLVMGVPTPSDIGPNTLTVTVTDSFGASATAQVKIQVVQPGPPPSWTQDPINLGNAEVNQPFSFNLLPFVNNPTPANPLVFRKKIAAPNWLQVAKDGHVTGTPQTTDLGPYTTVFEVSNDNSTWVPVNAFGAVVKGQPPVWLKDPILFTATVNKPFSATLSDQVKNPDGLALTFQKLSGPAWMTISPQGALSGTPLTANLGENPFSVSVTNAAGTATATVIVNVLPDQPYVEPPITIDSPVPGARVDNLWIVDNDGNACGDSCFISELKSTIGVYFDALDRAQVHHLGVYLSSDACQYRTPIADSRGTMLLQWNDPNWVWSFDNRISLSPGRPEFSSPLVAIRQFLAGPVATMPKPYFEAKVPMEMFILTENTDQYANYSHWPSVAGWTPTNFLNDVLAKHMAAKKPVRVSSFSPRSRAFVTLVDGTKGTLYESSGSMPQALEEYAKQVIFRANVVAKQVIPLTKKPDPSTIKITIAGNPIPSAAWAYDASANAIDIDWNKIDWARLKPGDQLVIQYQPVSAQANRKVAALGG